MPSSLSCRPSRLPRRWPHGPVVVDGVNLFHTLSPYLPPSLPLSLSPSLPLSLSPSLPLSPPFSLRCRSRQNKYTRIRRHIDCLHVSDWGWPTSRPESAPSSPDILPPGRRCPSSSPRPQTPIRNRRLSRTTVAGTPGRCGREQLAFHAGRRSRCARWSRSRREPREMLQHWASRPTEPGAKLEAIGAGLNANPPRAPLLTTGRAEEEEQEHGRQGGRARRRATEKKTQQNNRNTNRTRIAPASPAPCWKNMRPRTSSTLNKTSPRHCLPPASAPHPAATTTTAIITSRSAQQGSRASSPSRRRR